MNYLHNDRGQRVIAEGYPGSQARVRCEYPQLIAELQERRTNGKTAAAALRLIREAGVRGMMEYESLLLEAGYTPAEAASQGKCYGALQR